MQALSGFFLQSHDTALLRAVGMELSGGHVTLHLLIGKVLFWRTMQFTHE